MLSSFLSGLYSSALQKMDSLSNHGGGEEETEKQEK